jgi:hypothetical protein
MGLTLSVTRAEAGRPGNSLSLEQLRLGERSRPLMSDGGGLLLWGADAGVASVTLTGGGLYVFDNIGTNGCFLCGPNPDGLTWDGGCSLTVSDPNFGQFLDAGSSREVLLRDSTTTIKALPPTGYLGCTIPGWIKR